MSDEAKAHARFNMVACQLRPSGLRDERLAARLATIPRDVFVASEYADIAYGECAVSCNVGTAKRAMLSPLTLALMIERARISADDVVLDIAGGTGYSAAIMAGLAGGVIALEEHETLSLMAEGIWRDLGIDNAVAITAPLIGGVPKQAPFNVIFINGCIDVVPSALLAQLETGGRLVCVQKPEGSPKIMLYEKQQTTTYTAKHDLSAPTLPSFTPPPTFSF